MGAIAALLLAGTDTTASALEWFLLYMTLYPDVQEKCFQEINVAIGQNQPRLDDGRHSVFEGHTSRDIQTLPSFSSHCSAQHN